MDTPMDHQPSSALREFGAIHAWLDSLREELGARRWSVALREGDVWNVTSMNPSLHDGLISQLLNDERLHGPDRASLLDMSELGDTGARLVTAGVGSLLIVPGGPDARIVLDAPDLAGAQRFVAARTGMGTTFDLAAAMRAERLAADLLALAQWWPDEGPPPSTLTLEGTLLAGRVATAADTAKGTAVESRQNALLRERARIASVIHEGITQVLTNVAVQLEVMRHVTGDPDKLREMVDGSRHAVLQALESLRTVIFDLTPAHEQDWSDLVSGLRRFVSDFGAQWGIDVSFTVDGEPRELDTEIVSLAFAFVQEALTNVRRHAQTESAHVRMRFRRRRVTIEVADEGAGATDHDDDDLRPHQGLKIMQSRVRLLGGSMRFESTPGEGTTVGIEVPA